MSIFDDYARYYDLYYKDKDYKGESAYIDSLIRKFSSDAKTLLNLGSGSGKHDLYLHRSGYKIHGVELSEQMLRLAKENCRKENISEDQISFSQGDIRDFKLEKQFDVVVSLFHVISYQNSNEDLLNAFKMAKKHLKPGGVFIFDCWYGPAVLTDPPVVRVKRFENEDMHILRISEPDQHVEKNVVDVNFSILITDKISGEKKEIKEKHSMRYLFNPELEFILKEAGFKLEHSEEWMSGRKLSLNSWAAVFVCK